jgi:hypothetical protein
VCVQVIHTSLTANCYLTSIHCLFGKHRLGTGASATLHKNTSLRFLYNHVNGVSATLFQICYGNCLLSEMYQIFTTFRELALLLSFSDFRFSAYCESNTWTAGV